MTQKPTTPKTPATTEPTYAPGTQTTPKPAPAVAATQTPPQAPAPADAQQPVAATAKPKLSDILAKVDMGEDDLPDPDDGIVGFYDGPVTTEAAEKTSKLPPSTTHAPLELPAAATPWQDLVNTAIMNLEAAPNSKVGKLFANRDAGHREFPAVPAAAAMTGAEIATELANLADPFARRAGSAVYRPARMLDAQPLVALVALAQAIGSIEAMEAIAVPGHLTLVEGCDKEMLEDAGAVLRHGLAPQDAGVKVGDIQGRINKEGVLPDPIRTEVQAGHPVIAVADAEFHPAKAVAATLDARMTLRTPDTEGLIYILRLSHSTTGQIAEDAVRRLLPPGITLAQLSTDDIVMALRKPTALAVAAHLAKLRPAHAKTKRGMADYPMAPALRDQAQRLVEDIRAFREGRISWADCMSGILLYGLPGVGKTDFARMIAAEAEVTLIELGPNKTVEAGHLGDAIRYLNKGFAAAVKGAPCIILLDEAEAIGNRARQDNNSAYRNGLVAAYLAALDGMDGRPGVFVIAATNHPDQMDTALIRAGRFDRHLRIDRPTPDLIVPVLRWHLDGNLAEADLTALIPAAIGKSQAELACAVRDARAIARDADRALTTADLAAALSPAKPMSAELRARIAVHEAGHAIARYALTGILPERMMITPEGGEVHNRPDPMTMAEDFHIELAILLAGRAAEKILLGKPSAGAGGNAESDIARATKLAAAFEASTGLGTTGLLWLGPPEAAGDMVRRDEDLSDRVTAHLNEAEERAARVIREVKGKVATLAKALAKAGYLERAEVEAVVNGNAA